MQATLITCRNPFDPGLGRELAVLSEPRPLRALAPDTPLPFVCNHNGQWVLRRDWDREVLDGDVVQFIVLPQGGDDGGKNPIASIAMIALMVAAPGLGQALATGFLNATVGTLGGILTTATWNAIFTGAVVFAGSALINAAFGTKPQLPSNQQFQSLAAPSPTYSLAAQGNAARLEQAIPSWYGYNQIFPDFAADPYGEYVENEQYLYQLLAIGQGFYDVASVNIEDTAVASFEDIDYEIVEPGGTVKLFPANVATSLLVTGQELTESVYVGPFAASASGTVTNFIAIDVLCPRGLYFAADSGSLDSRTITFDVEARTIDNAGSPTGSWAVLGSESISGATTTPQRRSYRYPVTEARYEVRLVRTNAKDGSARAGHEIDWVGLRGYLPGTQAYGEITVLAMRMKASNQLSSTSARRINVIATRKLPTWSSGGGWTAPVATRSIAWAAADICRAAYGGDMADSAFDLAKLAALNDTWTARGDHFDGGFDQAITLDEALEKVLRAGRTKHYRQGGVLRFVRDEAATVPVAMFTPRNIVPGSWETQYLLPDEGRADSVDAVYWAKDIWSERHVSCVIDSSTRPETVRLFGVIEHDHAWREGMYEAAANRYRTRIHKFVTELEGLIPSPLDLVAIVRDRPNWGQHAEVVSFTGDDGDGGLLAGAIIEVDEPLTFTTGTHYLSFRSRTGTRLGPHVVTAGVDAWHVVLTNAIADWQPDTSENFSGERTVVAFGPASAHAYLARVLPDGIRVRSDQQVEISVVGEDDRVHTADGGSAPAAGSSMSLPTAPTIPVLANVKLVASGAASAPVYNMSWDAAPGATRYYIEQSPDGVIWSRVGDTEATQYSWTPQWKGTRARVAPIGKARGAWVTKASPDATVTNGVPPGDMDVPSLDQISEDLGVITTGKVQNLAGTNFMDLNASGSEDFLNCSDKVVVDADGNAYFEGAIISRNLVAASGQTSALNGSYAIAPGDGWKKLGSVIIDTGLAVNSWEATNESYVSTAGVHDGSGSDLTVTYSTTPGSFVLRCAVLVVNQFSKWRWSGAATMHLELELWAEVDGDIFQMTLVNGIDWKVYEVT